MNEMLTCHHGGCNTSAISVDVVISIMQELTKSWDRLTIL